MIKCEECLYRKNCQFLASHKKTAVEGCTAFKSESGLKAEAIKEFAERFIDEECAYCSSESDEMIFFKERFDNFLAEMAGGENA
ncbi:MAG: hypothetical protein IKY41_04545 [Clostridia bacterium]|nr:hypothetical protein [Clostridia bacterium]